MSTKKVEKKMRPPDFQSCSSEEVVQYVKATSPKQLETQITNMTAEQISTVVIQVSEKHDKDWKEKTQAIILGLNQRPKLEAAGNALSIAQASELINTILQVENENHWKLSPLLVGMPHETFSQILAIVTDQHLLVLQHEGMTKPVQHHLTTFSHEAARKIEEMENEIDLFSEGIENLEVNDLSREDGLEMEHHINLFYEFFNRLFNKANNALAIAWNTKRLDLIEALNKVKDSCQKYSIYGVGIPRSEVSPPTGLYAKLEEHLFTVYGDFNNPADLEAVQDDEPAMEGLVKLSVWYLKDYWEIGLLPTIKTSDELDLNHANHSEAERSKHREKLFAESKNNLQKIGLTTVGDLKRAFIFSKKTLQEYIKNSLLSAPLSF